MNLEILNDCLSDKTTIYKHHTIFTHLFCVVLRIIIGLTLLLYSHKINKTYLIILCSFLSIGFLIKFINVCTKNINIWKVYLRTAIVYGLSSYFIHSNQYRDAGLLIIIDALMGLQSRHISSAVTSCIMK